MLFERALCSSMELFSSKQTGRSQAVGSRYSKILVSD